MPEANEAADVTVTLPDGADAPIKTERTTSSAGPGARWRRDEPDDTTAMPEEFKRKLGREHWKRKEAERHVDGLLAENQNLRSQLGAVNVVADEATLGEARGNLLKAQADYKAAIEDPDVDKQINAQTRIAQWAPEVMALERASERRKVVAAAEPERTAAAPAAREAPPLHENAAAWVDDNPWFKTEPERAGRAVAIHNGLLAEGMEPNSPALFAELDARLVESGVKEAEGGEPEPRPAARPKAGPVTRQTAAPPARTTLALDGTVRTPTRGGPRTVNLSPEEQEMAHSQRMSPELFAIGKMRAEGTIDEKEYDERKAILKKAGRK